MCPYLGLEQTQRLELTPEMRLGVKVMAMTAVELKAVIEDKAIENPFLSMDESFMECRDALPKASQIRASAASKAESLDENSWEHGIESGVWDAVWEDRSSHQLATSSNADLENALSQAPEGKPSLEDSLLFQLSCDLRDETDLRIARRLLDGLDAHGYLHMDTDIVADELSVSPNHVERLLKQLQCNCTPAGIGARSLEERLIAQLEAAKELDSITRRVVENHLIDLASGKLTQIATKLNVPIGEIKRAFEKIRMLDPDPLSAFEGTSPLMMPEVVVHHTDDGWAIKVRKGLLPQIVFNSEYADAFEACPMEDKTAKQIRALIREAQGFLRAVDLRNSALAAIARVVVERQGAYFDQGQAGLRALTMAEVAQEVDLSEATVSRVANSVALDSPQGVRSLRFFFTSGVRASDGADGVSSAAVKQAIQELVSAEDPHAPLSDAKLVELLNKRGMEVSRRTVNKYRTALGILARSKRKRYQ